VSDSGEKQFEPTQARLAKARREGNLVRSGELCASVALLAALGATGVAAAPLGAAARAALIAAARGRAPWVPCAAVLAVGLVPAFAATLSALTIGLAQAGGLRFVTPSVKPERLDPFAGLKRMFSRESVGHAVRATLAFACAAPVVTFAARSFLPVTQAGDSVPALAPAAFDAARVAAVTAAAIGVAFGLSEYALARQGWLRKLRMTFAEYKRDLKEQDGDPQIRGRRRALHRSLSRGDIRRVKEATFIVCNPTHIAIALAYAPPVEPVPRVVVRAADDLARKVRELAVMHGVPTIENIALARALYEDARTGDVIPHAHYVAVAEVVAALIRRGAIAH
jgi:flagellar biosynthesis protein FlhB